MQSLQKMKIVGMILFFTFAAFVIASATTLEKTRIIEEPGRWITVQTPRDLVGKDQWYERQE